MANNFFKLLETYKNNYNKLFKKDLERIVQIDKDISNFLSSLTSWIKDYNKFISNNKYSEVFQNYLSTLRKQFSNVKSHLDTIDKYYNNNIDKIGEEFKKSGLLDTTENTINKYLNNLREDFDKIDELEKQCFVIKQDGESQYLNFDGTKIPLNYYDFLFRKSDEVGNDYSFFNYKSSDDNGFNCNDSLLTVNGDNEKLTITLNALVKQKSIDDGNLVSNSLMSSSDENDGYSNYVDYCFYSLKDKSPDKKSNQKTIKTVLNGKELMPIVEFYNYLLILRKSELQRYKTLYNKFYGAEGSIFSNIKTNLEQLKTAYSDWKEKKKSTIDNLGANYVSNGKKVTIETVTEDFIKNYLWNSAENSISDFGSGFIEKFSDKNKITKENVNAFLRDKTQKSAKEVQSVFDFCKDFIKQLENYDVEKNIEIQDKGTQNINYFDMDIKKTQLKDFEEKFNASTEKKELADSEIDKIFSFSNDDDKLIIDGINGISVYSIYGYEDTDSTGNNQKKLLAWDSNNPARKITEKGNYYYCLDSEGSSSLKDDDTGGNNSDTNSQYTCFPQGLYINLAKNDNLIKNEYLLKLVNNEREAQDYFSIGDGAKYYGDRINNLAETKVAEFMELDSETYSNALRKAATLASLYSGVFSTIDEDLENLDKDLTELENDTNELNSDYTDAKKRMIDLGNEESEIISAGDK